MLQSWRGGYPRQGSVEANEMDRQQPLPSIYWAGILTPTGVGMQPVAIEVIVAVLVS